MKLSKIVKWVVAWIASVFVAPLTLSLIVYTYYIDKNIISYIFKSMEQEAVQMLSLLCLLPSAFVILAFFLEAPYNEKEKEEGYTKHYCDICGENLKIGEGTHEIKKDGDSFSVCAKCLPTIISK